MIKIIIVMLGPQGSGKGTHAKILSQKLNIAHLSMGDALRAAAKEKTALGRRISKILLTGKLVPFEMTIDILKNEMKKPKYKNGIILDGFPRDMNQAHSLDKIAKVDLVIVLKLTDEEAVKRLGNRLTCRKCGEIYNLKDKKPKKEGICDKCNGELYQREDDKPAAIKKRLEIYHKETQPVIEYYRRKTRVAEVDTNGSIDTVAKRIEKAVKTNNAVSF